MIHGLRTGLFVAALATASALSSSAQHPIADAPQTGTQKLPDAPGRDTVLKLCGSCHSPNIVMGRGMTHDEWSELVASMVSRGAKGTQAEFTQVVDYLAKNLPPQAPANTGQRARRGGGGGFTMGPDDKQIVDLTAAKAGQSIYQSQCASCHGDLARGTEKGPDLVRSLTVLHDRYGSELGPFLKTGHPTKDASFSPKQVEELSHFLHLMLNDTLRSGPFSKVINVLTGDATAGKAYFDGPGGCSGCHSATGDLAGVAGQYKPDVLQQRFLFPMVASFSSGGSKPVQPMTVTVKEPGHEAVTGKLVRIDDFDVSLQDASGAYHTWKRSPELHVEKHDPYAAHEALLDRYTDRNIHDVVAYLETLK